MADRSFATRVMRRRDPRSERGFVLIAVLWVTALLSIYALELQTATVELVRTTRNTVEVARAELLADTGVRLAMLDLMRRSEQEASLPDAGRVGLACRVPDEGTVRVLVEPEAGKVNINEAGDDLVKRLLTGAGLDDAAAAALTGAIADFRDPDDDRRAGGAEREDYKAAGMTAGPKNAPFDSVDELTGVLGVSGDLFRRLRPHLTVHSGRAGIDARYAAPELVAMLAGDRGPQVRGGAAPQLTASFLSATGAEAYTIFSEGRTAAGTRTLSAAIVTRETGGGARLNQLLKTAAQSGGTVTRLRQVTGSPQLALESSKSFRIWKWERHLSAASLPGSSEPSDVPDC